MQVYRSTDNAKTWQSPKIIAYLNDTTGPDSIDPVITPDQRQLHSISCLPSGEACIAGGYSGTPGDSHYKSFIYATNNGGDAWFGPIQPTLPKNFASSQIKAVSYSKKGYRCLAVGKGNVRDVAAAHSSYSTVAIAYRSSDCISWNSAPVIVRPDGKKSVFNAISCDESGRYCLAVGKILDDFSLFSAQTENYGKDWSITSPPRPYQYSNMAFSNVSCSISGMQCTAIGYIVMGPFEHETHWPISYTSTDGGKTWKNPVFLDVPTPYNNTKLSAISCNNDGEECIAVGMTSIGLFLKSPVIYRTIDSGATWTLSVPENMADMKHLNTIFCTEKHKQCTLIGANKLNPVSYSSTDAGKNWTGPVQINIPQGYKRSKILGLSGTS